MRKNRRTGKRLRLMPLILGSYGAFLGFGLAAIGLAGMKEGIGMVRFLMKIPNVLISGYCRLFLLENMVC